MSKSKIKIQIKKPKIAFMKEAIINVQKTFIADFVDEQKRNDEFRKILLELKINWFSDIPTIEINRAKL